MHSSNKDLRTPQDISPEERRSVEVPLAIRKPFGSGQTNRIL
jgi:hypothetical protein